ncbi:hypothetical protein [Mitsuaria sp. TWR114]|nr:hypothetical protein [Mitsuaria sp. TWR114]
MLSTKFGNVRSEARRTTLQRQLSVDRQNSTAAASLKPPVAARRWR